MNSPTPPTSVPGRQSPAWQEGLLLVIPVLVAYLPALFCGYVWDDEPHILKNTMLTAPDALYRIWCTLEFQQYLPIQLTTFWAEIKLWGFHPAPFHALNILLHALNGLLIWRILKRLEFPAAWLAAAIFLLHPVNVETVAWITERRNLLSTFFYLSAVGCWLQFDDGAGKRWYWGTLALYVLALLSKTISCSLPVILLLLRWMQGKTLRRRDAVLVLPFLLVGVPMGLLTGAMERYLIGADGYEWSFSLGQRVLVCGQALWFYALQDLCPVNLMFIYPRHAPDLANWTQWLQVAAAVAWIAALVPIGRRFGRRAVAPVLFFGITVFPALGFANVYPQRFSFVADHFQYLASLGVILFAVGAVRELLQRRELIIPNAPVTPPLRWSAALLLMVLALLVWRHAGAFMSNETVWRDTLSKNDEAWLAHENLGVILFNRDDLDGALQHYEAAQRCGPGDLKVAGQLGDAYAQLGRTADARQVLSAALAASPAFDIVRQAGTREVPLLGRVVRGLAGTPPNFQTIYERHRVEYTADILLSLARLEAQAGDLNAGLGHCVQAMDLRPGSPKPSLVRGALLEAAGKTAEALADYRAAAVKAPASGDPLFVEGNLLHSQGQLQEAIAAWREAIVRQPDHDGALANLGAALRLAGRRDEARALLERALALKPDSIEPLGQRATLALESGDLQTAELLYRRLLALTKVPERFRSNLLDAQMNLGIVLTLRGQYEAALQCFKQVLEQQPANADAYINLARVHTERKDFAEAARTLHAGIASVGAQQPKAVALQDALAWLLATCPDERVRDGAEALRLAKSAVAQVPGNAQLLDSLAAAQAENGDYAAAVTTAKQAEEAANRAAQAGRAKKIAERLKLYESGKPYREGR